MTENRYTAKKVNDNCYIIVDNLKGYTYENIDDLLDLLNDSDLLLTQLENIIEHQNKVNGCYRGLMKFALPKIFGEPK